MIVSYTFDVIKITAVEARLRIGTYIFSFFEKVYITLDLIKAWPYDTSVPEMLSQSAACTSDHLVDVSGVAAMTL